MATVESLLELMLDVVRARSLRGLDDVAVAQKARPHQPLSAREREVVCLLARGYSNRQIAETLSITVHTVKVHVDHILAKLLVSGRTEAAVRAVELGYAHRGAPLPTS